MIYIENEQTDVVFSDADIESVKEAMLKAAKMQLGEIDPEINAILVSEETIQELNRDMRGVDSVTDVLSFPANDLSAPAEDASALEYDGDSVLLGDIAICMKRALEQAEEYGNTLLEEVRFLAVHGTLHIMGYDHMTEEDEKVMRLAQRKALGREESDPLD